MRIGAGERREEGDKVESLQNGSICFKKANTEEQEQSVNEVMIS